MSRFTFRSPRERRLWTFAASLLLAIYGSAYFLQKLLDPLRSRGLLGVTIWIVMGLAAIAAVVFLLRQRPGGWEVALLLATAGAYLLLLRHLTIVQERIHLLEYGLVGGVAYAALRERWPERRPDQTTAPGWRRSPALWAIVLSGAVGWGDELVQGLLPNRYYDLRDVATNVEAAALLVVVLAARQRLRRRHLRPATGAAGTPAIE